MSILPEGRGARWTIIGSVSAVMIAVVFSAAVAFTDRPQFCTSCHEMQPYYDAWANGPHKDTWCVDCHVGRDFPERALHKFATFKEIIAHFRGDSTFPMANPSKLPSGTCGACHEQVKVASIEGFDHNIHESRGPCQDCHSSAGHSVSTSALREAGVLNSAIQRVAYRPGVVARVNGGSANLPGHMKVACSRCHDMKATGCGTCHKPGHEDRGACETCHRTGARFSFSHTRNAQCQTCHTLPSGHFAPKGGPLPSCGVCHQRSGQSWEFSHPDSGDCASCHTPPANHPSDKNCTGCHKQGASFAFVHPPTEAPHSLSKMACANCHPSGYTSHTCTCHKNGTADEGGEGGEGSGAEGPSTQSSGFAENNHSEGKSDGDSD